MLQRIIEYGKQASIFYLQKNRAQSRKAGLSSRAYKERHVLLFPKPRGHAVPRSPERKGDTRVAPMVQAPRHQHHVGFDGRWLG